jgi:hypothetical protein
MIENYQASKLSANFSEFQRISARIGRSPMQLPNTCAKKSGVSI